MGLEKRGRKKTRYICHVKEFGFYPKDNGNLLKDFNKGSNRVRISFLKAQFALNMENGLTGNRGLEKK